MIQQRRFWYGLVFSVIAVMLGVTGFVSTKAAPPASNIAILASGSSGIDYGQAVQHAELYFHAYSQKSYIPNKRINGVPPIPINEGYSGETIAVSTIIWLRDGYTLEGSSYESVQLFQDVPTNNGLKWGSSINNSYFPSAQFALIPEPDSINPIRYKMYGQNVLNENVLTPDIYLTQEYTLPEVTEDTRFSVSSQLLFSEDGMNYESLQELSSSFLVKSFAQKIDVESGDIFVEDNISDRLVPTGKQTITSNRNISNDDSCNWITDEFLKNKCQGNSALTQIGSYTFADSSTSFDQTARRGLRYSLSKLAQEVAVIERVGSANIIRNTVVDFLKKQQTGTDFPKGEVLIIAPNTYISSLSIDALSADNITVRGKKLVVFVNVGEVIWDSYIHYDDSNNTSKHKLGVVTLSGNQILRGDTTSGVSDARFEGAFIALDVAPQPDSVHSITVGGTGADYPAATVHGLLTADNIIVNRQVASDVENIVVIKYDATFQNGTLVGLSPFLRPLVSMGN